MDFQRPAGDHGLPDEPAQPYSAPAPRDQPPMAEFHGMPRADFSTPVTPVATVPIWAQRLLLVLEVVVAVWAGIVLTVLPWTPFWASNPLLRHLPILKLVLLNNFTRGVLTGIGLLDIWIGIFDAIYYHDTPTRR